MTFFSEIILSTEKDFVKRERERERQEIDRSIFRDNQKYKELE